MKKLFKVIVKDSNGNTISNKIVKAPTQADAVINAIQIHGTKIIEIIPMRKEVLINKI
jgi:hypothetical protein